MSGRPRPVIGPDGMAYATAAAAARAVGIAAPSMRKRLKSSASGWRYADPEPVEDRTEDDEDGDNSAELLRAARMWKRAGVWYGE